MKKIIFVLVFGIFLIFLFQNPIISSSSAASSDDYSADYYTGISGGDGSNSEYDSEFAFMYQGTGYAENSEYSANIGIFPQPLFCGDGICNSNENCDTCSADCGCSSGYICSAGVCTLITTPSGETGAGGGGGACTYDWVCSEWYPEPCPLDGIQKRVCVNRGTCTGTKEMPVTNRTCIPEVIPPAEPLFDLFVKVPVNYKWILQGQAVGFDVELINVGNATTIDVFFKYWIVDENGRLIAETQETRAIGEKEEFRMRILLPENLEKGIYKIYVQINYDSDKVAIAEDSFEIVKSEFDVIFRKLISFPYILIPIFILFIFILILLKKRKKRKTIVKEHKGKPKLIGLFKKIKRNLEEHRRKRKIKKARRENKKEERRQYLLRRKRYKQYLKRKKEKERKRIRQYTSRVRAEKIKERRSKIRTIFSKLFRKKKKIKHEKPRKKRRTKIKYGPIIIKPKPKFSKTSLEKQKYGIEEEIRKKRIEELRKKIKKDD